MDSRFRPSFAFQITLAVVAGVAVGAILGWSKAFSPLPAILAQGCQVGAFIALGWLRTLAVPLIVSSIVLGGVGLEPMRGMGRLAGKTLRWIVFSSVLAVAVAVGVAALAGPRLVMELRYTGQGKAQHWPDTSDWIWGWLGLVLISLAFGYYRNQLGEGKGRVVTRFCQGLEEMLTPVLAWTRMASAWGIFFLTVQATVTFVTSVPLPFEYGPIPFWTLYGRGLLVLLATVAVYGLALSVVVWVKARVNPWRLVPLLVPAMLVAATGQSLEAALPLTMDALRRRAGTSNRVASVTLPLCASLHRDGMALGWTSVVLFLSHPSRAFDPSALIYTVLAAVVVGCGLGALSGRSGVVPMLFLGINGLGSGTVFSLVLGGIVLSLGGAVSVFSHACVTVIIAREEGEFWVPGAPPDADELQQLKNDLETAED